MEKWRNHHGGKSEPHDATFACEEQEQYGQKNIQMSRVSCEPARRVAVCLSVCLRLYLHMKGREDINAHSCFLCSLFHCSESTAELFAIIKKYIYIYLPSVTSDSYIWFVSRLDSAPRSSRWSPAPPPLQGRARQRQPGAFACPPPLTRTDISHGASRV